MDVKQKLQKQISVLREKLDVINKKEKIHNNAKYVGKFFKYMNTYGGDSEWPLYIKIISIDKYGNLISVRFQDDKNGEFRINTGTERLVEGGEEITEQEFYSALLIFMCKVDECLSKCWKGDRKACPIRSK